MTIHERDPVLRRKLTPRTPPPKEEGPVVVGPAPMLARSFGRAISLSAPLVSEEPDVQRKTASLPELLDSIDPDAFVTLIDGGEGLPALAVIEQEGFATVIEAMTIGRLGSRVPGVRRPTTTDAALLSELLDATFRGLGPEDPCSAIRCTRPVQDHRLLPVLMDETKYDLVSLTSTLVSGGITRGIRILLALPRLKDPDALDPETVEEAKRDWSEAMEEAVMSSPTILRAELGRVTLPLAEVMKLGVGSTLTLPLSNLEEVKLVALDGVTHAIGRLGQTRGMRAIRLTGWPNGTPQHTMIDAMPSGTGGGFGAPALSDMNFGGDFGAGPTEEEEISFPSGIAPMSFDLPE